MEPTLMNLTSGAFWALMLIAFGLGYMVASLFIKNKYKSELDKCHLEKSMLLNNVKNVPGELNSANTIKAVQTRGRSGMAVKIPEIKVKPQKMSLHSRINFERLGKATAEEANDLKMIDGIGPFIEEKLNNIGIFSFSQIGNFEDEDIGVITELLEFFPGRIARDNWVEQAKKLSRKYPATREISKERN